MEVGSTMTIGHREGPCEPVSSLVAQHSSLVTCSLPLALYLHIPFCVRKCFYCDFNSGPAADEAREAYVETLCREIRQSPWTGHPVRTVFFGGGTPSELTVPQLGRINDQIRESFCPSPASEWT